MTVSILISDYDNNITFVLSGAGLFITTLSCVQPAEGSAFLFMGVAFWTDAALLHLAVILVSSFS